MNSPSGFSLDSLAQTLQAYQQQLNAIQGALNAPVKPVAPEPIAAQETSHSNQQALLVQLYDEFVNTDDGKQLAAGLSKFARYVQSKADKPR